MPQHVHRVTAEGLLSETERLLVRWLLQELNGMRQVLGMPAVTHDSLEQVRRAMHEEQRRQRQSLPGSHER